MSDVLKCCTFIQTYKTQFYKKTKNFCALCAWNILTQPGKTGGLCLQNINSKRKSLYLRQPDKNLANLYYRHSNMTQRSPQVIKNWAVNLDSWLEMLWSAQLFNLHDKKASVQHSTGAALSWRKWDLGWEKNVAAKTNLCPAFLQNWICVELNSCLFEIMLKKAARKLLCMQGNAWFQTTQCKNKKKKQYLHYHF